MCLAVPGKVISMMGDEPILRTGRVDFGGVTREVNFCYVPEVKLGDYVVVHVGFALSIVDEVEAGKIFEYLREIGEMDLPEENDR